MFHPVTPPPQLQPPSASAFSPGRVRAAVRGERSTGGSSDVGNTVGRLQSAEHRQPLRTAAASPGAAGRQSRTAPPPQSPYPQPPTQWPQLLHKTLHCNISKSWGKRYFSVNLTCFFSQRERFVFRRFEDLDLETRPLVVPDARPISHLKLKETFLSLRATFYFLWKPSRPLQDSRRGLTEAGNGERGKRKGAGIRSRSLKGHSGRCLRDARTDPSEQAADPVQVLQRPGLIPGQLHD